jgi:hypothetical protein
MEIRRSFVLRPATGQRLIQRHRSRCASHPAISKGVLCNEHVVLGIQHLVQLDRSRAITGARQCGRLPTVVRSAGVREERLSHLNDHLPNMATRVEVFVCLDRLVEPENAIYHRLNPGNIHEAH